MTDSDSSPSIPLGYCQCGCGQITKVANVTSHTHGYVKGVPRRFVIGHHLPKPHDPAKRAAIEAAHLQEWASRTDIPYGYCRCGCGEKTKLATRSYTGKGIVNGLPLWYIKGHQRRTNPQTRYKVEDCGYETPCWVWQLKTSADGYAMVSAGMGRPVPAHHFYYEQRFGPLPPGTNMHHKCENPPCVNPDHLQPLSRGEHTSYHVRNSARSKLTAAKANEIRRLYAAGGVSQDKLARRYGVSQAVVSAVVLRKIWN